METSTQLATRLTDASRRKIWDVYSAFNWTAALEAGRWCMPPELISIFGTPVYEALSEPTKRAVYDAELARQSRPALSAPTAQALLGDRRPLPAWGIWAALTIAGFGFDTTSANNVVTFNNGAVGTVTTATATSLTVTLSVKPTSAGSLTAAVVTNSLSSGSPIQVATVVPDFWSVVIR